MIKKNVRRNKKSRKPPVDDDIDEDEEDEEEEFDQMDYFQKMMENIWEANGTRIF